MNPTKILFVLALTPLLTVTAFGAEYTFYPIPPPYYLLESGWDLYQIDCNENMEKLINLHGKPICVFPESSSKLIEKGYAQPYVFDIEFKIWHQEPFDIKYRIEGGTIQNMTSPSVVELIINIDSQGPGKLDIELPRALVDSVMDYCDGERIGPDDAFFVLVDHEEVDFQEWGVTDVVRSLSIAFNENSTEIEILGICLV